MDEDGRDTGNWRACSVGCALFLAIIFYMVLHDLLNDCSAGRALFLAVRTPLKNELVGNVSGFSQVFPLQRSPKRLPHTMVIVGKYLNHFCLLWFSG